jgi:hypothetical protein
MEYTLKNVSFYSSRLLQSFLKLDSDLFGTEKAKEVRIDACVTSFRANFKN